MRVLGLGGHAGSWRVIEGHATVLPPGNQQLHLDCGKTLLLLHADLGHEGMKKEQSFTVGVESLHGYMVGMDWWVGVRALRGSQVEGGPGMSSFPSTC